MNYEDAIVCACEYLYPPFSKNRIESYRLHSSLKNHLVASVKRLGGRFSVEPKDVYMLVESWIVANTPTGSIIKPLVPVDYLGD
jgi:hypothetical protein